MRLVPLVLLLAACGAPVDGPVPEGPPVAPRILLPLELLEPGAAAVGLWQRAGYDAPAAALADEAGPGDIRVLAHEGLIEGCSPVTGELSWGCTERMVGMITYVWLSDQVPADMVVSVLAHEFGHAIGEPHRAAGIMYPERSAAERRHPCVDDVCLGI